MQKLKIAGEKRKLQEEMKKKKAEMMAKFEKLLKKGIHIDREAFIRQIFNDESMTVKNSEENLYIEEEKTENPKTKNKYESEKKEEKLNNSILNQSHGAHNISVDKHEKHETSITDSKKLNESVKVKEPSVKYLNIDQIQEKVLERKKELEHSLYDVITKNEINEKKIVEEISEKETEEEKAELEEKLTSLKKENETNVHNLRKYKYHNI
jgi:hypothetical protein